MHEIERKFLVTKPVSDIVKDEARGKQVEQCYLPKTGEWTVRVRRVTVPTIWRPEGESFSGYVSCTQTMKRRVTDRKCVELEYTVTEEYFEKVRSLCGTVLVKTRHDVQHGDRVWEVDVFPQFDGLVVAEVELEGEDEDISLPDWAGMEVTNDKSFRNRQMAKELDKTVKSGILA